VIARGHLEGTLEDLPGGGVLGGVFVNGHLGSVQAVSLGSMVDDQWSVDHQPSTPGGAAPRPYFIIAIACSSIGVSPIERRNSDGFGETLSASSLTISLLM